MILIETINQEKNQLRIGLKTNSSPSIVTLEVN